MRLLRLPRVQTIALLTLSAVSWLVACSESPCASCPPPPPPPALIASDPIPTPSSTVSSSAGIARSASIVDNTVYVSLLPGTVPEGGSATVHVVGSVNTVITSIVDGGFDPVPIAARVGDSIEVVVTDAGSAVVQRLGLAVSARRPPVVVRTEPPPKKRDHPLNAPILVVFSEPVALSSITPSSVRVLRGSTPVAGTVSVLPGTSVAAFIPRAPLEANADYSLVVTRAVKDLQGDLLEAGVTVPFTTGQSSMGAPASLALSPTDSVYLTIGETYQFTATVRDAAGNQLIGQTITWSTTDPNGLTISSTGLVTALATGGYWVSARLDSLVA